MKAVGRRCTKAVAISTPVPKCCDIKMNLFGPALSLEVRRDIRGNPHAAHRQHKSSPAAIKGTHLLCSRPESISAQIHAPMCYMFPWSRIRMLAWVDLHLVAPALLVGVLLICLTRTKLKCMSEHGITRSTRSRGRVCLTSYRTIVTDHFAFVYRQYRDRSIMVRCSAEVGVVLID